MNIGFFEHFHLAFGCLLSLLGACFGSFAALIIHRLPLGQSIITPGSHCSSCSCILKPWQNIPIVSWIFLRGKCGHCRSSIGFRPLVIELILMMGMLAIYIKYDFSVALIERFFFLFLLVCLAYIDLDTFFLPYGLLLALFALGMVFNFIYVMNPSLYVSPSGVNGLLSFFIFDKGTSFSLSNKILGALLGFTGLIGVNVLMTYVLRRSSRLTEDQWAMGFGDPLLLCAIGLFVGIDHLLLTIFLAASVGSIVGILFTFKTSSQCKDVANGAIPFGPFLAIAAIFVYLL